MPGAVTPTVFLNPTYSIVNDNVNCRLLSANPHGVRVTNVCARHLILIFGQIVDKKLLTKD